MGKVEENMTSEKTVIDEAFKKYVEEKHIDGWASYDCKKGLWGACGS